MKLACHIFNSIRLYVKRFHTL